MFEGFLGLWQAFVRPDTKINSTKVRGEIKMNIGDKVIAVGLGRKTQALNGCDMERPESKLPGFSGLVVDMVVMTVTEIDGNEIRTKHYTFHKDDLHLVDSGRASAAL